LRTNWANDEQRLAKKCANLSLKFGDLRVGEIEQQIFLCVGDFLLGKKKFGEINPWREPILQNLFFFVKTHLFHFSLLRLVVS